MKPSDLPAPVKCRSCRAEIVWAKTVAKGDALMPVNPAPTANGNLALHEQTGNLYAAVVTGTKRTAMAEAGYPLYQSHFVDCPHAKEWRRNP